MIDVLPQKLDESVIREYFIKYAETGNDEYREKIIVHNLRLVLKIVYDKFATLNLEIDDMFSVGVQGLIKAVDSFNVNTGYVFATYAGKCICNEILMFLRREKKHLYNLHLYSLIFDKKGDDVDYNDFLTDNVYFDEEIIDRDIIRILKEKISSLSDSDQFIINSYYGLGCEKLNQCQISEAVDVSQSQISRKIRKILYFLRNEVRKEFNDEIVFIRKYNR